MKFKVKEVGVTKNPIMIIGQNPGRSKDGKDTGVVWDGGKSTEFLMGILGDTQNLVLTNLCNYQDMTEEHIDEGFKDLKRDIYGYLPRAIITLGYFPRIYVDKLELFHVPTLCMDHPSQILRFKRSKMKEYSNTIKEFIGEWK